MFQVMIQPHNGRSPISLYLASLALVDTVVLAIGKINVLPRGLGIKCKVLPTLPCFFSSMNSFHAAKEYFFHPHQDLGVDCTPNKTGNQKIPSW